MSIELPNFEQLNLDPAILKALQQAKYTQPTPIQQQAIPIALQGKDLIATSQTGTGKTAAFALPILQRLCDKPAGRYPRILIITPTRELAEQITLVFETLGRFLRFNIATLLGGMPYHKQERQLSRPLDIIVATPGRLMDFMRRGLNLSQVEMLVLDEADRMLDMGFIDDVEHIAKALSKDRQTLLFTATLGDKLGRIAKHLLREPTRIEIEGQRVTLENITQQVHLTRNREHKLQTLQRILDTGEIYKAIIFSGTKRNADDLADQLRASGHNARAMHGDMSQQKRTRMLTGLTKGSINILVATDVAARGIDVPDISHVINYDIPQFAETYVHRIGRTGRAGKTGIAISLMMTQDIRYLRNIERFIKQSIMPDDIKKDFKAMPDKRSPRYAAGKPKPGQWQNKKPGNWQQARKNRQERAFV